MWQNKQGMKKYTVVTHNADGEGYTRAQRVSFSKKSKVWEDCH